MEEDHEREKGQSYSELLRLLQASSDAKEPVRKKRKVGLRENESGRNVQPDTDIVPERGENKVEDATEGEGENNDLQAQEPSDEEDEAEADLVGDRTESGDIKDEEDDDNEDGMCF